MARYYKKEEREEKKKMFLEAYEESKGMTTTSCIRAGITRDTLLAWRKKDKDFDSKVIEIKDKWKEWVEGRLMTLIENGNTAAVMFFLKCKGGYQEKQKVEIEQTGEIDIKAAIENIKKTLKEDE